ncbi:ABC transporter substrate-binding protein [candidate division WOR-3 bacterium]|nr:ABC transporter substrate-binding protein [candidate division WOR-3 bacterium]
MSGVRTAMTVVALAALALCSCGGGNAIRVGLIVPLTGDVKTFGESTKNGAMMAFEDANAAGGINGRKIRVIVTDDKNDPTEAANAGGKLIDMDRVVAIVGSVSTKCSLPLADRCQMSNVPMITPTSTNPKVTVNEDGSHKSAIFRACFTDSFQGAVAARFAAESLRARTAAVMYDVGNDYSRGLADYFRRFFEQLGGRVVGFESYQRDDVDFSALLAKVRQQSPDLLFLPDYYTKVGLIAKQARGQGLTATLLGGDGWDSPAMLEIAGEAIAGAYFVNHYSPDEQRPEVQSWVNRYQAKYGQRPDALATLGYDAALLLVEALRSAEERAREGVGGASGGEGAQPTGELTREYVIQALGEIADHPCVSGTVTLDGFGNPIKRAAIIQYTAEGQRYVATVSP